MTSYDQDIEARARALLAEGKGDRVVAQALAQTRHWVRTLQLRIAQEASAGMVAAATGDIEFHPLANIFPLIEGTEFDELVASIKEFGLRDPIVLHEGAILDGRNRYRACREAGVDAILRMFPEGADPLAYVIDKNLRRRQLNDDQRRMVAARLANLGRGRPAENPAECGIKVAEAARLVNVDAAGTERARTVLTKAAPEIQSAVDKGKMTVAAATQAAKLKPEKQKEVAELALAGQANVVRTVIKAETRAVREADLAEKQHALPQRKFGVILADPEWRFEPWSRLSGMDRAADNHYPTSCTEVIAARDVPSIAADDCVLLLWATAPMLPHALLVMSAWGFDYRSNFVWAKDRNGTGYWNRNSHEHLLIGVRGNVPAPAPGTQWGSLIEAAVGRHSEKPEVFLELVEAYFPNLPKIELNRRGPPRPGWKGWGNEATGPEAQPDATAIAAAPGPGGDEPRASVMPPCPHGGGAGDRSNEDRPPQDSTPDDEWDRIVGDMPAHLVRANAGGKP